MASTDRIWTCQVCTGSQPEHTGHIYFPLSLWMELRKSHGLCAAALVQVFTRSHTFYGIAFPAFSRHQEYIQVHDASHVETNTDDIPVGACRVGKVWFSRGKESPPIEVEVDDSVDMRRLHASLVGRVVWDGALVLTKGQRYVRVWTENADPFLCLPSTVLLHRPLLQRSPASRVEYIDDGAYAQVEQIVQATIRIQADEALHDIRIPQGILLSGPPGVGKTHLVHCICRNNNLPLQIVHGPEVLAAGLGQSEASLRRMFIEAEQKALACAAQTAVLFFDEIDSIAEKRGEDHRDVQAARLLGQLLVCLDGAQQRSRAVVFIGATNRPNAIDAALRRPGRLDREIAIEPPKEPERARLLASFLEGIPLVEGEMSIETLAQWTHGYVPADLCALVRHMLVLTSASSARCIDRKVVRDSMAKIPPSLLKEYRITIESHTESWEDLGGVDSVKARIQEVVEWPLIYPEAFSRLGIRPIRGLLLHGPPGCSKTSIARILAASHHFSFFSLDGAAIFSCYVGEAERLLRTVFACARRAAPSLIFLDEVDALVGVRGRGADQVQERVLSTLLNEMDGIVELAGVIVLGATNRPDLIDAALMRPGRFDCLIPLTLPDTAGRLDILQRLTRKSPLAVDVDLAKLASESEGASGAVLRQMVQEAALGAIREDQVEISMRHFYHRVHCNHKS